ncbi:MAG: cyclic nucleotide-binding domain-containing protein [Chloroflexota bacterium]
MKSVAEGVADLPYPANKMLMKQGSQGDYFYMIYSGSVNISRLNKDKHEDLASLGVGDFFGEEVISTKRIRTFNAITLEESILLVFPRQHLETLFTRINSLKANITAAVESQRLIRSTKFNWVQPGEVIYFLARKHPILFIKALTGPILLLLVTIFLFWFSISTASLISLVIAWVLIMLDIAWGVWNWIDWGNDYYIVTNKRVIWLEKVIGLYDSRQEAPLNAIISVGVETDQIGRLLDYGDVIVRTFVGRIRFHHVLHPNQAASLVEEQWVRMREISINEDATAMKQAIRERLGLSKSKTGEHTEAVPVVISKNKVGVLALIFSDIFKVRIEDSGTITYRKHWFVLLKSTLRPGLSLLFIMILMISRLINLLVDQKQPLASLGMDTYLLILVMFFVLVSVWWLYKYLDWRNDIYQVTQDQIVDIDKTPLGRIQHKAAPLENILSTEYKRIGLLEVLLNFGNVYITVGGAQLIFEDVADPPTVQQDIDQRRIVLIANRKDVENRADRDRLADWFVAYHDNTEAFQTEAGLDGFNDIPESDEFDVQ